MAAPLAPRPFTALRGVAVLSPLAFWLGGRWWWPSTFPASWLLAQIVFSLVNMVLFMMRAAAPLQSHSFDVALWFGTYKVLMTSYEQSE